MAINKYTQPIQARYVPTSVDPNLMMAMLQKKEQESALVDRNMMTMESSLAGINAYGKEDSAVLQKKQSEYNKEMASLYEKYGDNPNLMLNQMKDINKRFSLDAQSGDLAGIQQRYTVAQGDITDAQDRFAKGDLNEYGYRTQMEQAGTGFRAQKDPKMFEKFTTGLAGTNYASDAYNGSYEMALNDALGVFKNTYRTQLSYMTPEEQQGALLNAAQRFTNKWRADRPDDNKKNGSQGDDVVARLQEVGAWRQRMLGAEFDNQDYDEINAADYYFEDGMISGVRQDGLLDDGAAVNSPGVFKDATPPYVEMGKRRNQKSKKITGEELTKAQDELKQLRKDFKIPDTIKNEDGDDVAVTDQMAIKMVNETKKNTAVSWNTSYALREDDQILNRMPQLVNKDGRRSNFTGQKFYIGDKPYDGSDIYNVIAEELGFNIESPEDMKALNAVLGQSPYGELMTSGNTPGSLVYTVSANGKTLQIEVENVEKEIENIMTPVHILSKGMRKGSPATLDGVYGAFVDDTGDSKKPGEYYQFDKAQLEYEWIDGAPVLFAYALDKNDKRIKLANGKFATLDLDNMAKSARVEVEDYYLDRKNK